MGTAGQPKTNLLIPALLAVYIIWGSTYLGMKIGIREVPPFLLSGIRFIIAGSVLFAWAIYKEKQWPSIKQVLNASLIGFLLIGIGNSGVAFSLKYMPSGLVSLIVAANPAWFILLDYLFFSRKKVGIRTLLGIGFGFIGLFLIFNPFSATEHKDFPLWPIGVVVMGSMCWVTGSLLSPRLKLPQQLTNTAIQTFVGGIAALVMSAVLEDNQLASIQSMTHVSIGAIAYLIIFGSWIGYTSYSWLINNAPPRITATYAYVNPVVALFLGWSIAGEQLSLEMFAGSVIVILGVVLMTLRKH